MRRDAAFARVVARKVKRRNQQMTKKNTLTMLLLATALGVGTTALAQEGTNTGKKQDQAPAKMESQSGNASSVPEGQGGTAGSHPTGANVGPGRAGQVKTPGQ
jgi:hypothetical protein